MQRGIYLKSPAIILKRALSGIVNQSPVSNQGILYKVEKFYGVELRFGVVLDINFVQIR